MKPAGFKFFAVFVACALAAGAALAQNAEALLTRDILASQKTLAAPVRLYNYFQMNQSWSGLNSPEGRRAYTQQYLSSRAGMFWDSGFTNDSPRAANSGGGLYLAIDPYISMGYGNTYVEMTVPAGTKFINVVRGVPVKRETLNALIAEGFMTNDQKRALFGNGFYRDTLRVMVAPQYARFRGLMQEIFSKNGIQFVEYNFNTSLMGFCRRHSYSAFVYVGIRNPGNPAMPGIDPVFSQVVLHSDGFQLPNLTPAELSEQARITKFRSFLYEISEILKAKKPLRRDFMLSRYTDDEMNALRAATYSCEN